MERFFNDDEGWNLLIDAWNLYPSGRKLALDFGVSETTIYNASKAIRKIDPSLCTKTRSNNILASVIARRKDNKEDE